MNFCGGFSLIIATQQIYGYTPCYYLKRSGLMKGLSLEILTFIVIKKPLNSFATDNLIILMN